MTHKALLFLGALLALAGCTDEQHEARRRKAGPNPGLAQLLAVADAGAGRKRFGQCLACHTIAPGGPDMAGPNLHGVYERPIGKGRASYGYSAALRDHGGVWDAATLDAWMKNPQAVVRGTAMVYSGVADPLDRADIIAFLREEKGR